jgi:hypothetical protein
MEIYDGTWKGGCWPKDLLVFLNGPFPSHPKSVFWDTLLTGNSGKATKEAISEFHVTLHSLVDSWLDSGRRGSEDRPWERIAPLQILKEFMARNPPRLEIKKPNGSLCFFTWPSTFKQTNQLIAAGDIATYLVLLLMDSPERARLSRCDVCGTYFVRARTPKKDTPIYHGVFCEKHKGKGGAKRTKKSRDDRKDRMVDLAAEFWPQWKPSRSHGKQSEWVAARMNKGLAPHEHITGKWVTQHRSEIEAKIERRKHAKG